MPGRRGVGCVVGGKTDVRQARRQYAADYHYDSLSGFRVGIGDSIWQQGNLRAGKFADTASMPLSAVGMLQWRGQSSMQRAISFQIQS